MTSTMERLRLTVEEGNYYEAQQLIKTLYFRFFSQKKMEAAKEILINGAFTMLNAKQSTCGAELIQQLLKLFADIHTPVDETTIDTIVRLASLIPSEDQCKISVLNSALKWSSTNDQYKQGHPDLHSLLAKTYSDTGEYTLAQKHYLKSNEPEEFAKMLIHWSNEGYKSERDLFITRSVLMYLSMSNLRDANIIFNAFVSTLSPQQITPLINFTRLLLLTLEQKTYTVFNLLRQKYASSLARDPSFPHFVTRIGQVFYREAAAAAGQAGGAGAGFGGLFNNLLKSFMGPQSPFMGSQSFLGPPSMADDDDDVELLEEDVD